MNSYNEPTDHPIDLDMCIHCKEWVHDIEIRPETNHLCNTCKELDFCDCGEVRSECSYCSMPWVSRKLHTFRENFIYKLRNVI
jgi:hypothetical protein